jgi:hypothetical protein
MKKTGWRAGKNPKPEGSPKSEIRPGHLEFGNREPFVSAIWAAAAQWVTLPGDVIHQIFFSPSPYPLRLCFLASLR